MEEMWSVGSRSEMLICLVSGSLETGPDAEICMWEVGSECSREYPWGSDGQML